MKNLSLIPHHLSLITVLAAATAWSSDDDGNTDGKDIVKSRQLTIMQVEQPDTRATLGEENEVLSASWTAGDVLTYATLSKIGNSFYKGTLTAKTTAPSSAFTGSVMCSENNKLAVIYPQTTTLVTNSPASRLASTTLSTISDTFRFRAKPCRPVAQNTQ